ncbi:MAG: ABC transporter ATP-binding protein [Bacteroidetes bacterium]|nr:ABC transporter ATP-binding protein [Bacteroidota bacterium]
MSLVNPFNPNNPFDSQGQRHMDITTSVDQAYRDQILGIQGAANRENYVTSVVRSGIGKTTLLKTLAGISKAYGGDVRIDGKPIRQHKRIDLAKLISLVPQEHTSYFDFTVKEMVLFGRTPYIKSSGFLSKKDNIIADKVIQDIGIGHIASRYYNQLSGGEKRLVFIALALVQETKIILFDEPTTSLDMKNALLVISNIKQLALELKKTIIVTMHDINQCASFTDQILLLYTSNRYSIGTVNNIINAENLNMVYGVDFQVISVDNKKIVTPILS